MTPTTMIIALLSVLAGYVSQAVNTGSLFGIKTLPKAWLPYLTIFGTFLAAFVPSISSATTVNGAAWFAALIAGLTSLTGTAVGVTVHQHMSVKVGAMLLFIGAVCAVDTACTPQATQGVFSAIEAACQAEVLASSQIPTGTTAATVAEDIALACGIAGNLLPKIEQIVIAFEANQVQLGKAPAAGAVYVPSPMVVSKRPGVKKVSANVLPFRARERWALFPRRLAA